MRTDDDKNGLKNYFYKEIGMAESQLSVMKYYLRDCMTVSLKIKF